MPFHILRDDITNIKVDAIVNAANTDLQMGGGVCGAIFRAAGAQELQAACDQLAPIRTGGAVVTPGFGLHAKYIIHAAGPVYAFWNSDQNQQYLSSAYTNALKCAVEYKCKSIAFPLLSTGHYGYPKGEALNVATDTIRKFLHKNDMIISLVIFDRESLAVSEDLLGEVQSYIDEHYVETHQVTRRQLMDANGIVPILLPCKRIGTTPLAGAMALPSILADSEVSSLDKRLGNLDEPFAQTLLRLIDSKGRTDAEVYRRANITRQLFSKIRTGKNYMPGKRTILALAIALELTLEETDDLLRRAGYALSQSQKFDVIVSYFIVKGNYDIFAIDQVLFSYDLPTIGV